MDNINLRLRMENWIKTVIHSSVAIENNLLPFEQVTAVLNGKKSLACSVEIKDMKDDLFVYCKQSELHILIKSCIFYYEFEFIQPFSGGNVRIERICRIC